MMKLYFYQSTLYNNITRDSMYNDKVVLIFNYMNISIVNN